MNIYNMEENENMNNYFAGNAVCVKLMNKLGCCVQKVKKACRMKKEGSAVIGEVLVMIVVVAMAALFKSGGLKFIQEIWTTMTTTASTMFS
jgi:hypothetical protein